MVRLTDVVEPEGQGIETTATPAVPVEKVSDEALAAAMAVIKQAKAAGQIAKSTKVPKTPGEPKEAKAPKFDKDTCLAVLRDFIVRTGTCSIMKYYMFKMGDGTGEHVRNDIPSSGTIARQLGKWPTISDCKVLFGEEFVAEHLKSKRGEKAEVTETVEGTIPEGEADIAPPVEEVVTD